MANAGSPCLAVNPDYKLPGVGTPEGLVLVLGLVPVPELVPLLEPGAPTALFVLVLALVDAALDPGVSELVSRLMVPLLG